MNVISSNRFTRGRTMNETPTQKGFGVRPISFRVTTSVSPRKSSTHTKRLRRVSMDQSLFTMANSKTKVVAVIENDTPSIESEKKNGTQQPIKRLLRKATIKGTSDGSINQPVQKLNRNVSSITIGRASANSVVDSVTHTKRLRRVSIDQSLCTVTSNKTKAMAVIDSDTESVKINGAQQPIKRPFHKTNKPVQKLNMNVSSITNDSASTNSVVDIVTHAKRLRRVSMDQRLYTVTSNKTKAMVVIGSDIESMNKNGAQQPIQRLSHDTNKPVRKLNRNVSSITIGSASANSVVDIANDDGSDGDSVVLSRVTSMSRRGGINNHRTSNSKCTSSLTPFQGRKVRFPIDESGMIQCQIHHLSEEDAEIVRQCEKRTLWWSKKDRVTTRDIARFRIQFMEQSLPAYQSATVQLLAKSGLVDARCIAMLPPTTLQQTENQSSHDQPQYSDAHAIQILADCSDVSRGLEKFLYRAVGIPPPSYRSSVKRIIATQHVLKSSSSARNRNDPDFVAYVLAAQYMRDTAGAIAMARLLADSDTLAIEPNKCVMLHI